ncbi:MAG: GNAT family protein [Bacteroidota bacterium]
MKNWLEPVVLSGSNVDLIPLEKSHKDQLLEAASDGELWNLWYTSVPSKDKVEDYIHAALDEQKAGTSLPFVVVDKGSGKIIGSTRYCNVSSANKRVEIGYTWYSKSFQRTGVNTECKLLLLSHAFETLEVIAVAFMTNWHNHRSRNAILRLGAKQDGILRNHRLEPDGTIRDTVVFSIIRDEWKSVKKFLEFEVSRARN